MSSMESAVCLLVVSQEIKVTWWFGGGGGGQILSLEPDCYVCMYVCMYIWAVVTAATWEEILKLVNIF